MANTTLEPAGPKDAPPRAAKPTLAQALKNIFSSKDEGPDEAKVIARRRNL